MTNVHPSSRPGKLPRMRRGIYRPLSIISHAASVWSPASGIAIEMARSRVSELCDWLNFDFPALRCGHSGSVGVPAHQTTRRRAIRYEDHPFRDLAFDAPEGCLTKFRSNSHIGARPDTNRFHIIRMHRHRPDDGLIFRTVLTNIDLLSLLRCAARVHDEAPGLHRSR